MYLKKIGFIMLLSFIIESGYSQIISQDFYNYRLDNMYTLNPAYSGKDKGLNFILNAKSQNKGVSFSNKNLMAGMHTKISEKQAIGAKLIYDSRGAFQVYNAELTYAYSLKINKNNNLHFGINAGVFSADIVNSRIENYDKLDLTDESLDNPYFKEFQFTSGIGLLYQFKKLNFGVSLPALLSTNTKPIELINANLSYFIETKGIVSFEPWVMYQNTPYLKNIGSLFVKATFYKKLWVQAGYQTNESILASAGFEFNNFSLGYGFNFNNKAYSNISKGSNEVTIKFRLLKNKSNSGNSLNEILKELDKLANTKVNDRNKESIKKQLSKLKKELIKIETESKNPKEAQKLKEKLDEINLKLTQIENNLK